MNTLSRVLVSLLAILGVGALGYYAYTLSSETLTFPFAGSEHQRGSSLELAISPPSLTFGKIESPLLDEAAVKSSLLIGSTPLSSERVVSGEYSVSVDGGYVHVGMQNLKQGSTEVILSADLYNKNKTTAYRLPRDIVWTPSDIPRDISFSSIDMERDQSYDVSMYGFDDHTPDDLRYYVHYETGSTCAVSDSWGTAMLPLYIPDMPMKGPQSLSGYIATGAVDMRDMTPKWVFHEIRPTSISPALKDGQIWRSQVRIPYDLTAPRVCIVAGVSGYYRTIEDRTLSAFTVTGVTLATLSPEYDMESQIEFSFSDNIYTDSGTLYTSEYIEHRLEAKIDFLKHLDVSPSLSITPDELILTPDRAIITVPLKEGQKYTFSLRDIEDVYGRKDSVIYDVTPKSEPFLSLKLSNAKSIYKKGEPIPMKLYSLEPKKTSYSLSLCRVTLEPYARLERMISSPDRATNALIATLLSNPQEASNCMKKEIVLAKEGYVSNFSASDLVPTGTLTSGLYILTLSNPLDIVDPKRFFRPIIFSVVDTNLTMKVDASGKIMILATDITTGKALPGQDITVMRNITRTYTESWNQATQTSEKNYLPLTSQAFAPGVSLGRTDADGFLEKTIDTLKDSSGYDRAPYGLSFEDWWSYEGRYDSFIVESRAGDRLGYLVSTWNDGVTGYNFGIKDSDYSWSTRGNYSAYLHTDRKLYLPGEKVYIHAILRKNNKTLDIPTDTPFDIVVTDPMGREIKRTTQKSNEFGSIGTDIDIAKDASLGSYGISIVTTNATEYVENGGANFQVEVFKNPTFTATVSLKSPDLENDSIRNLRKVANQDPYTPWYGDVYTGNFNIEGIVKAKYYNGAEIKNTTFNYRVYRSDYYSDDYWGDCFWGCYYEPPIEFYTEGTGTIGSDGYGIFRVPVEYSSFYSDYKYTVEITLRDALSGEEVTTPGTLIVKLPASYKSFSPENPLSFTPKKKILSPTDTLAGEVKPLYGKWDQSLSGKYRYEIIHREYQEVWVDDIRAGSVRVTNPVDHTIASGAIASNQFSYKMIALPSGEYHMRILPIVSSGVPPDSSISDILFYISGDISSLRDNTLRVIPEHTVYKLGETAHVLIQVPFTGSHLLITKEKGGVIDREYVTLSGNTLTRDIQIDDTVTPNAYIGVVAFAPNALPGSRSYAVGYGEIVTDIADKKSLLTIIPNKTTYKNRESVNLDLTLTDRSGNPLQGEVTLMAVDESLIRLLGNIDLDVIAKFYQKFPFTVKTSLSLIGIERNKFLSRKGSNGGSGDKGGGGIEIASRILFKNTAYYNPSIRTDASGKAKVSFTLPDNITDYRIIAISSTRDSRFGVAEKTIEVRKDYVLETHVPLIARNGDIFTATVSAFNSTNRITPADIFFIIGTGASQITKQINLNLDAGGAKSTDISLTAPASWQGTIPYTVELREKGVLLDSITQTLRVPPLPIVGKVYRSIAVFTGTTFSQILPKISDKNTNPDTSTVDISISTSYASQMQEAIRSLLEYPYGCIEQTVSSTIPNAIALSLADTLGVIIDKKTATLSLDVGLKKILRMQHWSGGWVYWEGASEADISVTPFVLRSLVNFRELGQSIPKESIDAGANYIITNESTYKTSPDTYAEATWALSSVRNEQAAEWWKRIDPNSLSPHGYLAYAYAAQIFGRYTPQIDKNLENMMLTHENTSYWYWSGHADRAIYVRLLFERGENTRALAILDPLVRTLDMTSYYVSTQEKVQFFLALAKEALTHAKITTPLSVALRSDGLIGDISLSPKKIWNRLVSVRTKVGEKFSLKSDSNTPPLYVTTTITDRPKDIMLTPAYSTGGMEITRNFEEIDESRGVDSAGEFLVKKSLTSGVFKKGNLYRVTLTVKLAGMKDKSWYHLALEDYFSAGWRPIRGIFQTESALFHEETENFWDYVESRDDRILADMSYGYGEGRTYSYYIRPESLGTYLLPPATAYFMYRPEIHSYTKYQQVQVVQGEQKK